MVKDNKKIFVLTFLFASILLLSIFSILNLSHAQVNGESLEISNKFEMIEFGVDSGQLSNVSSFEYSFPSISWNLTNIELNFTDINFQREICDIEADTTGHTKLLNKAIKGYAVQINITEPTKIFGVYIYGDETSPATTTDLTVQINGFDIPTNKPNDTVYRSVSLNMSSQFTWYYQAFTTPIILAKNNYSLILNGTEMGPSDAAKYYWEYNDVNPTHPNLYSWSYESGVWADGTLGEPFLYKLDQKLVSEYFPQDINMTVEIEGNDYPVLNGIQTGTGNLSINLNISLNSTQLTLPIKNNKSSDLITNLTYSVETEKLLISIGSVKIKDDLNNKWNINFDIHRFFDEHSVVFYYPKSWLNLSVSRNVGLGWYNVSSNIIDDEINNILIIPNNIIEEGSEWNIIAYSPNIDFILNFPISEWDVGHELQFSVDAPIIQGNLTFVLINTLGFSEIIQVKEVISEEIVFTYNIPSNLINGSYTAKVYWNNITDAGVQSQVFSITIPETTPPPDPPAPDPTPTEPIDPFLIILIVAASVGATISIFVSYRLVRSYRNKRVEEEQKLFNKCMDILNLDYLIVSDKKSGLNVYEQKFTGLEMNGTLISGFLQAIHQFGIELIKVDDQSQTIKLDYANSIIIMTEFVNLRLILILRETPSKNFLYSLEDLAYDIYQKYGKLVEDFNGDIKPFKGIEELLRLHLNISFIYPLKLASKASSEKIKINQDERAYINKAVSFMMQTNKKYFYIASILPEKACSPKDIEYVMDLIEKNIFQPIID